MVDPDAPSPSDPNLREYLHWYAFFVFVFLFFILFYFPLSSLLIPNHKILD